MEEQLTLLQLMKQLKEENASESERKRQMDHFFTEKANKKGIPFSGGFELTPLCNLDCRMCYVHLNGDKSPKMKILSVKIWKDLFRQAREAGMQRATLTGGECLTYPEFDELYLDLYEHGIEVNICTNGILLNDKRIEFLKQHPPRLIQVSLYGSNNDTYECVTGHRLFDTVFQNILKAHEAKLPIRIAITPSIFMADVTSIMDLAYRNGIKFIINRALVEPRAETGRILCKEENENEFYIKIFKHSCKLTGVKLCPQSLESLPPIGGGHEHTDGQGVDCNAGRSSFHIRWNGMLTPCTNFDNIQYDAVRNSFIQAWEQIRNEIKKFPHIPQCDGCAYANVCNKCPGYLSQMAGPGKQYLPWCEQVRMFAEAGINHLPKEEDVI